MRELVNLVVDLSSPRLRSAVVRQAHHDKALKAFTIADADDAFLAWVDYEFGGAWSSEAFAGKNIVVRAGDRFAGFAAYDPRGMKYSWLRGLGAQEGVGIFGPFGVAAEFRGSKLGPALLKAALAGLREEGYSQALIPAVGSDKLIAYYEKHGGAHVSERFERTQWSAKKYRTVVLASGQGTNFQAVVERARSGALPLDIVALIANDSRAFALERARAAGIDAVALPWDRRSELRPEYDEKLSHAVRARRPDLVLLLGWMHLLDDRFIAEFPETINLHPAFLPLDERSDEVVFPDGERTPAFRGASAIRDALAWGSRWTGASAHRITLHTDRGPVLVRKPMRVNPGDSEENVLARLHPIEHEVVAQAVMRWVYER